MSKKQIQISAKVADNAKPLEVTLFSVLTRFDPDWLDYIAGRTDEKPTRAYGT